MQSQMFAARVSPQLLPLGSGSWDRYVYGGRPYFVYTPANYRVGTAVPMVVMLHGCLQLPIDIACDSRMNQLADKQQFVVVYPQHAEPHPGDANPMLCWNFFYGDRIASRNFCLCNMIKLHKSPRIFGMFSKTITALPPPLEKAESGGRCKNRGRFYVRQCVISRQAVT